MQSPLISLGILSERREQNVPGASTPVSKFGQPATGESADDASDERDRTQPAREPAEGPAEGSDPYRSGPDRCGLEGYDAEQRQPAAGR